MASNTSICGICSLRQITKTSDHWCPECEEAICDECKEHHKVLKATRNHEPIPISQYKSLPSFITDIQHSCIYHNEKYQLYCTEHSLPICFKCIKDHQKCRVMPFEEITYNAKTSEQIKDLETRLVDLLQNIDQIKKDRKANVISIEKKKTQHVKTIKQIRVEINKHLDNLERQLIKDLEEKECLCKESIQKVLLSVTEKETMITQCHANVQSIKQYASDLQTFLGMREIEVKVNENEQYLQSLIEAKRLEQLDLVCKVETGVQSILNNVKHFGSIEIKNRISNIEITRAKYKQAQLQVTVANKTVNDVKLFLRKMITTHGESVTGCCISKEGNFLVTDHYKNYKNTVKSDGTLKHNMSVDSYSGFDLTFVDEKTVAITSGDSNKTGFDIINTVNRSEIKFIKLPGYPFGITRDHDSLFVCVERRGIYIVNTLDYTISRVISCNLPSNSYVSVFADKIYFTDRHDHSVVCFDHNGSHVWTFKDDSILKCPRGITVDNDGNVFVVGEKSSNVVFISNDGKHHKEVITKQNGLYDPTAIFLDKQKKKLIVANYQDVAFLYHLT